MVLPGGGYALPGLHFALRSGNRDFAVQIDILHRIDQLHAVGHRFLKRLTTQDQPHAARAFVNNRRAPRLTGQYRRPPRRRS